VIAVHTYDQKRFPFAEAVSAILGVEDLTALESGLSGDRDRSVYKNMELSPHYKRLTDALLGDEGTEFRALYHRLIAEEIRPQHDGPILYQACPTVRLLFADASGASRFHRDRDYGHDPREINHSLALTAMFGTNAIWIESAPDKGDYVPIVLEPGQYVIFDGVNLRHGARPNTTGRCRVSFDFRVRPDENDRSLSPVFDEPPKELNAHLFTRCA
jgi:hypothetical protein